MLFVTLISFVFSSTTEKSIIVNSITKNFVSIENLTGKLNVMGDIDTVISEEINGDKVNFEYLIDKASTTFMSIKSDFAELSIVKPYGNCRMNAFLKNEKIKCKTYNNCTRVSAEYKLSNGLEISFKNPNTFFITLNVSRCESNNGEWKLKCVPGEIFTLKVVENEGIFGLKFNGADIYKENNDNLNTDKVIPDNLVFKIGEKSKITLHVGLI